MQATEQQQEVAAIDARLGRRVRDLRERRGWSQGALSEELEKWTGVDWHQTTITKVENGHRPVRASELVALGFVFNVGPAQLLGGSDGDAIVADQYLLGQKDELESVQTWLQRRQALVTARMEMSSATYLPAQQDHDEEEEASGLDRKTP